MFTYPSPEPLTDFSEDKLNLKSFADDLTSLVVSQLPHPTNKHSKVIALDSGWGTGKTSFINMWTEQLETDKFTYLIYNAWENDDSPNALIPILCSFLQEFDGSTPKGPELKRDIANIVSAFGPKFLGLITQVTCGVNLEGFVEAYKEYREKKLSDMIFEEFSARQKHKELFRKLTEDIRGEHSYLLICIDELDRCRPTFAIETLEVVKHFFDIPNVVFVFSLDRQQLSQSIKSIYGNIDSTGYLQRFFDYTIPLPKPKYFDLDSFLKERLEFSFERRLLSKLSELAETENFSISLRTLNVICAVYNQFKIYTLQNYATLTKNSPWSIRYFLIHLTFIALACSCPEKYWSLLHNGTSDELGKRIFELEELKMANYTEEMANGIIGNVFQFDQYFPCNSISELNVEPNTKLWQYIDRNIQTSWMKAKETESADKKTNVTG